MTRTKQDTIDRGFEFETYQVSVEPEPRVPTELQALSDRVFGVATERTAVHLLAPTRVPTSGITYVCGYSGSGKSTLLRQVLEQHPEITTLPNVGSEDTPLELMAELGFSAAVSWLSSFGLGEPRVMRNPYRVLSEGQKLRLRLALLMKDRPRAILLDEFLSVLDRTTARLVAYRVQRLCRRYSIAAILASAHDDLIEPLAPDHVVSLDLDGSSKTEAYTAAGQPRLPELEQARVEEGTLADYEALARYHYADDEEEEVAHWRERVRQVIVVRYENKPIAVVVSITPLPLELECIPLFAEINRRVMWRYRTVVHPAFRGVGLTLLAQPVPLAGVTAIHSYTVLGLYFPFHERAGYVPYQHPRRHRLREYEQLEAVLGRHFSGPLNDLNRPSVAQQVWQALGGDTKRQVRNLVRSIVSYNEANMTRLLCEFACIPSEATPSVADLRAGFAGMVDTTPDEHIPSLLSAALFIEVQGFVKHFTDDTIADTLRAPAASHSAPALSP